MRRTSFVMACSLLLAFVTACSRSPVSPDGGLVSAVNAALSTALGSGGGAPAFLSMVASAGFPFGAVSNATGGAPADASTPLYIKRGACSPTPSAGCQLKTPDGEAITWGQWSAVEARMSAKCIGQGTHIVVHVSNAVPNGVYSLWFNGLPLGEDDGSENAVHVSAAGEGQLSAIDPAGCAPAGSLLILAYHNDGQLHGAMPGGVTTWAGQVHRFLP